MKDKRNIKFDSKSIPNLHFKGRVHCFSVQVIMNKSFLLNPEKNWHRSVLLFSRKTQKRTFNFEK